VVRCILQNSVTPIQIGLCIFNYVHRGAGLHLSKPNFYGGLFLGHTVYMWWKSKQIFLLLFTFLRLNFLSLVSKSKFLKFTTLHSLPLLLHAALPSPIRRLFGLGSSFLYIFVINYMCNIKLTTLSFSVNVKHADRIMWYGINLETTYCLSCHRSLDIPEIIFDSSVCCFHYSTSTINRT